MKKHLSFEDFKKMVYKVNNTIQDKRIFLSELDRVIGDGDHGVTMAKGMASAIAKIEEVKPLNIADLLKTFGNAITVTIGGVGGPIFGAVFSEMSRKISNNKEYVDLNDLCNMFSASLEKTMTLGRGAKPGDKTMVDAFYPAVKSLERSLKLNNDIKETFKQMAIEAKKGAESTKDMISSRGKSSYCGERSIGYEDAGANTMYFIFQSFYDAI